ncbi:MAG TPA: hypothetical protein VFU02_09055 [Polyangiaceae bacterium]|nr:hypothetical protein [Polyangiaceae bacterium]
MRFRWFTLATVLGATCSWALPAPLAGHEAASYHYDAPEPQQALARGVSAIVQKPVTERGFHTGAALFDREWVFGTYMMAAMGLGQVADLNRASRDEHLAVMQHCIDQLLTERVRRFDTDAWGTDALRSLSTDQGHVAYLGYLDLVLGLHRKLDRGSRYRDLNDAISNALWRRYRASRSKMLATYPNEYYPVDNLAAIGALALHARVTGADRDAELEALVGAVRARYLDRTTGLLIQRVDGHGRAVDAGRGSGTALGAYFASWASPALASSLHGALKHHLTRTPLGFGMVREYVHEGGSGDIDSGPILLGMSISATGFSLASARVTGDFAHFEAVYRTAHLFGAPTRTGPNLTFVTGGPLGNALMLALMTAPRPGEGGL